MFVFRKIWRAMFSCNTHFETRPFALLPTNYGNTKLATLLLTLSIYLLTRYMAKNVLMLTTLGSSV